MQVAHHYCRLLVQITVTFLYVNVVEYLQVLPQQRREKLAGQPRKLARSAETFSQCTVEIYSNHLIYSTQME